MNRNSLSDSNRDQECAKANIITKYLKYLKIIIKLVQICYYISVMRIWLPVSKIQNQCIFFPFPTKFMFFQDFKERIKKKFLLLHDS